MRIAVKLSERQWAVGILSLIAALLAPGICRAAFGQTAGQQPQRPLGVLVKFKDGKSLTTQSLKREGNNVIVSVPMNTGSAQAQVLAGASSNGPVPTAEQHPQAVSMAQVGYSVANIARIEFPVPPQIKSSTDLMLHDKPMAAIAQIEPIVAFYRPFQDVPGNWWPQAASLKLSALVRLKREGDAEALITDLARCSDPEAAMAARVQQAASMIRRRNYEAARPLLQGAVKESRNPETLALAWVAMGDVELAAKNYDPALLAYLHVPVYFPEQEIQMPASLLGSARAFAGLSDFQKAQDNLDQLKKQYPSSSEASASETELKKIEQAKRAEKASAS